MRASVWLDQLDRHRPDIADACRDAHALGHWDGHFYRPDPDLFAACPSDSIDYAVMEKADKVAVLRADFKWNDVGSFAALGAIEESDTYGNVSLSFRSADSLIHQSENCIVYGEGPRTVALFGVSNLVVVQTDDAVLVCPRNRAEELKELIQAMRHAGRTDLL